MAPVTRPEHQRIAFTGFHRCSWSHGPAARIVDYRKDSGTNRAQASVRRRCASEFSSRPAIALRDSPHRAAMRSRDRSRAPVDVNSSMVRATWLSLRQSSSKMAIRSALSAVSAADRASAYSTVRLPSRMSPPTGFPVLRLDPTTSNRSSASWNASPSGRPTANAQCLA